MNYLIVFTLCLIIVAVGCTQSLVQSEPKSELELISSHSLSIPEPSGLALDLDGQHLWTISDQTNKIYKISLNGEIMKTLSYQGEGLEGITQNPIDSTLWVTEERLRQIVHLDRVGEEIERITLPSRQAEPKHGLEGITFNYKNGHFYLLNEKRPRLLIELDTAYALLHQRNIDFMEDCSGISYDRTEDCLWILSDDDRSITKCSLDGKPQIEYQISVPKPEGIAVDVINNLIYIVSDRDEKLYIFSK